MVVRGLFEASYVFYGAIGLIVAAFMGLPRLRSRTRDPAPRGQPVRAIAHLELIDAGLRRIAQGFGGEPA